MASKGRGNTEAYVTVKQPVYLGGNVYLNGAEKCEREEALSFNENPGLHISEEGEKVYLEMKIPQEVLGYSNGLIDFNMLGTGRLVEEPFQISENENFVSAYDYEGNRRTTRISPGPFEKIQAGKNKIEIWSEN